MRKERRILIVFMLITAMLFQLLPQNIVLARNRKVTVSTQQELTTVLKDNKVCIISIKTSEKERFKIPQKTRANVKFIINAGNASVVNKSKNPQLISIKSVASFLENGSDSVINIIGKADKVTFGKKAANTDLTVNSKGIKLTTYR